MQHMILSIRPYGATHTPSAPQAPDGDVAVLDRPAHTAPPPMYQVVLHNDDYTPMDFVVQILREFFNKTLVSATNIMYEVHTKGRGICGIYPRDIAQTRVQQVIDAARAAGHPLNCSCEPAQQG